MPSYRRVTNTNRFQIKALLQAEKSVVEIAQIVNLHKSTIFRELKRNGSEKEYCPETAQLKAVRRFSRCRRKTVLNEPLKEAVRVKIEKGWSPEQISGRFKREGYALLSYQTIYKFVREDQKLGGQLFKRLRRPKKPGPARRSQRKRKFKWMLKIKDRPEIINRRKRLGDWERDTMYAAKRKMVLVCTERKSRYVKIEKVEEPKSVYLPEQTKKMLRSTGKPVLSLTKDNGGEFLDGFCFDFPVYYCDPQRPQQRGTVENQIGLLRQYISRKTDLNALNQRDFEEYENILNLRPRKGLDYKTPHEVFYGQTVALAI